MSILLKKNLKFWYVFFGFQNQWNAAGTGTTLFSSAFEAFREKDCFYIECHLWILGFQIFELSAGINKVNN